jgi:hypothetical protein
VAQDVDKSLKPKYKAKDFHKISSENKTGTNKSIKGKKKMKKEKDYQQGRVRKKERKRRETINVFLKILPWLSFY